MTQPEDDFGNYFDAAGQPVRAGVQLSEDEEREYAMYAPHFGTTTTPQTITEESA